MSREQEEEAKTLPPKKVQNTGQFIKVCSRERVKEQKRGGKDSQDIK